MSKTWIVATAVIGGGIAIYLYMRSRAAPDPVRTGDLSYEDAGDGRRDSVRDHRGAP